jgi:16S rRNA (cytosine967-C5)-methyltransferase
LKHRPKIISDDARKTALFILNALDQGNKTLDSVLENILPNNTLLSRRDRALIQALVFGVLRWRMRLDWIIKFFSKTSLRKVDPKVLNILRLGLFQIIYLNRIPVSAAVNTSVEMAKSADSPWIARYVNGLLRNAAREHEQVPFPDINKDPVSALAVKKSFPKWVIERLIDRLGIKETELLCDAVNTIPPITVRVNTLKNSREELIKSLHGYAEEIACTKYAPSGVLFSNPKSTIAKFKAFEEGLFQVQDEAAQLVTMHLNPQSGETVLDACAGLGGKTGHIAQMMNNRGRLLALDVDEKKLMKLEQEMYRLGVSISTTCVHDLNNPLKQNRFGGFDRILLDAPCSGLGVLRRNPDAKWTTSKQKLVYNHKRQGLFLDNVAHLLKPSGVLVYSVCSTEPEENESVIENFLSRHKDFALEKNSMGLPVEACSLLDKYGYFRTFPHLHYMDGFFSASLKRIQ